MTSSHGRGLHLAAAVDQRSAYDAGSYVELARLAESGGLDFVTLDDTFARPGPDALAVLSRVAPATNRIGLVPTVTTTHTEPFQVQAAVATLDWVSRGRAGWRLDVSTTEGEARLFGRRHAAAADALWQEAGEVAEAAAELWDSWEDDAEIRDTATGRFVDRDKLHHVDFQGSEFSVKGPSIVPRPPQGHPVRVVDATEGQARRTAARYADVALVRAASSAQAGAVRTELRASAEKFGRDPDTLRVLASLVVDLGDGEHAAEPGHGGGGPGRPRTARCTGRPGRPRGVDRGLARRPYRRRLPPHARRTPARPGTARQRHGRAAPTPGPVPHVLPGQHPQGAPRAGPARQPVRGDRGAS